MSANVVNQVSYLRTSREFPAEITQLTVEINKSYVDIANAVNSRTISIFPINRPAINGESWFINQGRRQQGFRQVYIFTSAGNIPHGLNLNSISAFVRCFGSYTDGTNWYGAIYGSNSAIPQQISFYITPTNIVVVNGGAGTPTITTGTIVLEWISQV